ncbi:galactose-6-phosphate isomerase subunit LacB [Bacillus sonorensis]|uniref:Galactose-6-phosphate isomerase subunit LacB n=2 Tax=Bacillus sonorensis TaxID=119858 RepID=M5P0Z6_9BACI|nr:MULTISPECIES: galactose-6-phosphate isomerase subunit LacB [Bacillus]TWK83528.1 Galactose-6-phosphate isomerase subunit LacB [Bacillus paralicheniformis]ASB91392.1 Ribose-5-phosphate isomerase [Bacillus sonorensis]EME73761.1 galactose-6-phosphate isomerase subunit LacB [Bacillus sonorensis L12]MCF7615998.1 galactose-6-phosphate isomerase subunit LacB [Bacillus sonorensis]MCY8402575.1 galactose-6-phosphate isomerase subunit LacB [Bacillus sonorensis]
MKIALGCDHIVTDTKMQVSDHLKSKGHQVIDVGTYDMTRTHYPIFGKKAAEKVVNGEADLGVVLCGTGVGISVSACKVPGIRGALVRDITTAKYAKEQLNANLIGVGGRITGLHVIQAVIDTFIETKYKETPENQALIKKLSDLDHAAENQTGNEHFFDDLLAKWERGEYHD